MQTISIAVPKSSVADCDDAFTTPKTLSELRAEIKLICPGKSHSDHEEKSSLVFLDSNGFVKRNAFTTPKTLSELRSEIKLICPSKSHSDYEKKSSLIFQDSSGFVKRTETLRFRGCSEKFENKKNV